MLIDEQAFASRLFRETYLYTATLGVDKPKLGYQDPVAYFVYAPLADYGTS